MQTDANNKDLTKLSLLKNYFFNRTDYVAGLNNSKICPLQVDNKLDELILGHLNGDEVSAVLRTRHKEGLLKRGIYRIGTYSLDKNNFSKWLCIDFDGAGHSYPLKNPLLLVSHCFNKLQELGIRSYIERSSGGTGFHLWIFFSVSIPPKLLRQLAFLILPDKIELADGLEVSPDSNRGVEIYPKQLKAKLANPIWLPFGKQTQSAFGGLTKEGFVEASLVEIETTSLEKLNSVIGKLDKKVIKPAAQKSDSDWSKWKTQVLACLDLKRIYDDVLAEGVDEDLEWIQCRDPWAKNGDVNPSAGIATGKGKADRGTFHSFIDETMLSVFEYVEKRGFVSNRGAAYSFLSEATGVPLPDNSGLNTRVVKNGTSSSGGSNNNSNSVYNNSSSNSANLGIRLPVIRVDNRQLITIIDEAWLAIEAYNNRGIPRIFRKDGLLVDIDFDKFVPKLKTIVDKRLYGLLARIANWTKNGPQGSIMNTFPTKDVGIDMMNCTHGVKDRLPELESVITTPIFSANKEIVYQEGYHKGAKVWYAPSPALKEGLLEINLKPSLSEVKVAKQLLLMEVFGDFPHVTMADIAHTVAAMLLPFVRQMIQGPTPLHVVEAPSPGSGKSKLCNIIGLLFTGEEVAAKSIANSEDEVRKAITAEMMEFKPIILFDNVSEKKRLESASLASVLSMGTWGDRVLGMSEMVYLKNTALWMMTGNNPQFSMEIARRCIRIRLDAKVDQPWKRTAFKHKNLESWVLQNRPVLIKAILTLVQYWISIGSPLSNKQLGTYECWAGVMGGILEAIEIKGFLGNLDELYEQADAEGGEWRLFVAKWAEAHGEDKVTTATLLSLINKWSLLPNTLEDGPERAKGIKLNNLLKQVRDRTIGNYKVVEGSGTYNLEGTTKFPKKSKVNSAIVDTSDLYGD